MLYFRGTADDLTQSPGEEEIDLQDLMTKLSSTDQERHKSDQTVVKEDGDNNGLVAGAFGLYKTKGVSNYEISTALYGAKDDTVTTSEDAVGGNLCGVFFTASLRMQSLKLLKVTYYY